LLNWKWILVYRLGLSLHLRNCSLLLLLEPLIKYLSDIEVENKHHSDVLERYDIIDFALVDEQRQIHVDLLEKQKLRILVGRSVDLNLKIFVGELLVWTHRNWYYTSYNLLLESDNHIILLGLSHLRGSDCKPVVGSFHLSCRSIPELYVSELRFILPCEIQETRVKGVLYIDERWRCLGYLWERLRYLRNRHGLRRWLLRRHNLGLGVHSTKLYWWLGLGLWLSILNH